MGEPTRGYTLVFYTEYIGIKSETQGTETSKYLQEKKTKVIPRVAASEKGTG